MGPRLGWGGCDDGGPGSTTVKDDDGVGSRVAASEKFCENGVGAGGWDISFDGEGANVPAGNGA